MLKALFKKEFLEINSGYFMNRKTGKMRSKGGIIGYVFLFIVIFGLIGLASFSIAKMLCVPFCALNLSWFYFAIMGLISLALSVFGSVFNTYTVLYLAKDNELLLSMPIKSSYILLSRMTGVFAIGILYEAIIYIPMQIAWYIYGNPTVLSVIYGVFLFFMLGFVSLVLTCILGYFVALIAKKAKSKSLITVISSIVFISVYYIVYFNIQSILQKILKTGEKSAKTFKNYAYICYVFGSAQTGKTLYLLGFLLFTAAIFAICFLVLSKSFKKIVTFKSGEKSGAKQNLSAEIKVKSADSALLSREFKRFLASPVYMLNCGIGLLIMVALSIFLIVKADYFNKLITVVSKMGLESAVPIVIFCGICLAASTCYFTAPSISLEGNWLWILKSLPVTPKQIFAAKQKMHLYLSAGPVLLLSVCCGYVFKIEYQNVLFIIVGALSFVQFIGASGLLLNLKMPNLNWTNESVPVKQGAPVMICLFGGWILSIGIFAAYYFLRNHVSAETFLVAVFVIIVFATRFINNYISQKGEKMFMEL